MRIEALPCRHILFLPLSPSKYVKDKSRSAEHSGYVHTVQLTSPITNLAAAEFTQYAKLSLTCLILVA